MVVSHDSPPVTTPSPQTVAQSVSFAIVAPDGQHWSPLIGVMIGVVVHIAAHVPPPMSESVVQLSPSLQLDGHAPG